MFYGPPGTGKAHAVESIANELNALLIHISPAKLKGNFMSLNPYQMSYISY